MLPSALDDHSAPSRSSSAVMEPLWPRSTSTTASAALLADTETAGPVQEATALWGNGADAVEAHFEGHSPYLPKPQADQPSGMQVLGNQWSQAPSVSPASVSASPQPESSL
jgi:hypothetical protein